MRTAPEYITELKPNEVFTFGSNLKGAHGAGAAKQAVKWGAIYGQGEGLMGQTYALPTKDENIKTLPIKDIYNHINNFIKVVEEHSELTFLVTPVGTGLAGYLPVVMAQMFKRLTKYDNVYLPKLFTDQYFDEEQYWDNLGKFENDNEIPDVPQCTVEQLRDYYVPRLIKAGAIPLKEMEDGGCYYGKCRNTDICKWDAEKGKFVYWRHKWGLTHDEEIHHFENDHIHDVFIPIKKVTEKEFNDTK